MSEVRSQPQREASTGPRLGRITTRIPARLDRLTWSRWHWMIVIGLGVYLAATAMTALSFSVWWFFLFRFLTGFGIGGEYSAINSSIDELIPSRHRGRIDIIINGTYWAGAAVGALITVPVAADLPVGVGWRVCFALGVVLGLVILLVRRHGPESPRWMFIHGHDRQAEELVDGIEVQVTGGHRDSLPEPRRTTLGLSFFVRQAFLALSRFFDTACWCFYAVGTLAGGVSGSGQR
jgi:MFS family permease